MIILHGTDAPALRTLFSADRDSRPSTGDPSWDTLPPVWSGGQADRPVLALVFVNPTYRNQGVRENWPDDLRAPHIGFRRIWSFLVSCQLLPGYAAGRLPSDQGWDRAAAEDIYRSAADSGLYVTNLVKACRTTSVMPTVKLARSYRDLLMTELGIVRPWGCVAMGSLVTSVMTGKGFRVRDGYEHLGRTGYPLVLAAGDQKIIPSYFPSGRGEPQKAREIMTAIRRLPGCPATLKERTRARA